MIGLGLIGLDGENGLGRSGGDGLGPLNEISSGNDEKVEEIGIGSGGADSQLLTDDMARWGMRTRERRRKEVRDRLPA